MGICKGSTQWVLVALCPIKKNSTNMKMSPKLLRWEKSRDGDNGTLCPLDRLFYSQPKQSWQHRQQQKDYFCWKPLYHSLNNC